MMEFKACKRRKKLEGRRSRSNAAATMIAGQHGGGRHLHNLHSALAIQLSLDLDIASVRYVASLPLFDRIVPIQMVVADTVDGPVAFDIVDARPERDLDEDGLMLLTLQHHQIRLVEIDRATIGTEPRAGNCRKIWRHRNHHVEASLVAAVDRAVAEGAAPSIRTLGRAIGLRYPMATVCALICHKHLQTDLGKRRLDLHSVVRRLARNAHAAFHVELEVCGVKKNILGSEYGETK